MTQQITDENKDTLLYSAVESNNIELVKLLLGNGANMYAKNTGGINPLQLACDMDLTEIIKIFCEVQQHEYERLKKLEKDKNIKPQLQEMIILATLEMKKN
jgi:ankyrin repeat protein